MLSLLSVCFPCSEPNAPPADSAVSDRRGLAERRKKKAKGRKRLSRPLRCFWLVPHVGQKVFRDLQQWPGNLIDGRDTHGPHGPAGSWGVPTAIGTPRCSCFRTVNLQEPELWLVLGDLVDHHVGQSPSKFKAPLYSKEKENEWGVLMAQGWHGVDGMEWME